MNVNVTKIAKTAYKPVRNLSLFALFGYGLTTLNIGFFTSLVNVGITSLVITATCMLIETMMNLRKHKNTYISLEQKSSTLKKFHQDGEHLPSLYKTFEQIRVDLKPKHIYLGSNKTQFERPYKFIMDVQRVIKRVDSEQKYINKVPPKAFDIIDGHLYNNDVFDTYRKSRWEFFLKNMELCLERDDLLDKYTAKYGKPTFNVMYAQQAILLKEHEEMLNSLPDHLNEDLMTPESLRN